MTDEARVEAAARAMEPGAFATYDGGYTQQNFIENRRFLNAERVVKAARRKARAALAAADAADREAGFVRVPREPTEEMLTAGRMARMNVQGGYGGPGSWEAMLAASPSPERS